MAVNRHGCWESDGADGYTLEETTKDSFGTDVILTLKKDTEDEKFSDYLESYRISQLVKKYSDYIRYPIKMMVESERLKEGTGKDGKDPGIRDLYRRPYPEQHGADLEEEQERGYRRGL